MPTPEPTAYRHLINAAIARRAHERGWSDRYTRTISYYVGDFGLRNDAKPIVQRLAEAMSIPPYTRPEYTAINIVCQAVGELVTKKAIRLATDTELATALARGDFPPRQPRPARPTRRWVKPELPPAPTDE